MNDDDDGNSSLSQKFSPTLPTYIKRESVAPPTPKWNRHWRLWPTYYQVVIFTSRRQSNWFLSRISLDTWYSFGIYIRLSVRLSVKCRHCGETTLFVVKSFVTWYSRTAVSF